MEKNMKDYIYMYKWTLCSTSVVLVVKNPPVNEGHIVTQVRSLGWEDLPGGGNGNPLQYSSLEKPMDRGAWWATIHGVAKSQTWLSDLAHACTETNTTLYINCSSIKNKINVIGWSPVYPYPFLWKSFLTIASSRLLWEAYWIVNLWEVKGTP